MIIIIIDTTIMTALWDLLLKIPIGTHLHGALSASIKSAEIIPLRVVHEMSLRISFPIEFKNLPSPSLLSFPAAAH